MIKKPFLICLILVLFSGVNFGFSQAKISELLQDSTFHSETPSVKLFMIEFWATWCGPCITVSDYLEVLQEQFSTDLYILSISEETSDRVKKFLNKRPSPFASAIDYDGQTFEDYGVTDLPNAVLLNSDAEVLWKGNPADLTPSQLRRYINRSNVRFDPNELIQLESYVLEDDDSKDLKTPFELLPSKLDTSSGITLVSNSKYKQIEGSLQQLLGYLMKVSPVQIQVPKEFNTVYVLKIKPHQDLLTITETILKSLDLRFQILDKPMDVLQMDLKNTNKLWNPSQFDWGTDSPQFLVDDYQFSADNSTVADFMYKLSELLKISVFFDQTVINSDSKFDWQLHYKFFDLMADDLIQNFGIEVKKIRVERPTFYVVK